MKPGDVARSVRVLAALVALLFGAVTLVAGGRVILGADPGYEVFRPLVLYNTAMGIAYVAVGALIWRRRVAGGKYGAGVIFALNLTVLVGVMILYRRGGGVAVDSVRAMTFRTLVWLVLFLATAWLARTPGRGAPS